MKLPNLLIAVTLAALTGCASAPTARQLAGLPTVTYPEQPATPDYIYRLPAGQPIDVRVLADGNLLTANVEQMVSARLKRDIYLHKDWASEDGKTWLRADKLVGVNLSVTLPSYQTPRSGEIHLSVNRKEAQ